MQTTPPLIAALRVFMASPTACCKLLSYEEPLIDAYTNKVLNTIQPVTKLKPAIVSTLSAKSLLGVVPKLATAIAKFNLRLAIQYTAAHN